MKYEKCTHIYHILLLVFGTLTLLNVIIFGLYVSVSVGHNFNPWGMRIWFSASDVSFEPNLSCTIRNDWAQGAYNAIFPKECSNVTVNGEEISWETYLLNFDGEKIRTNINGIDLETGLEDNYILSFPASQGDMRSNVAIELHLENGTLHNILKLCIFFLPTILFVIVLGVSVLHLRRIKPTTTIHIRTGQEKPVNSVGVVAIVFGVASFFPYLGFLFGIIAILLGIIDIFRKKSKLGVVAIAFGLLGIFFNFGVKALISWYFGSKFNL